MCGALKVPQSPAGTITVKWKKWRPTRAPLRAGALTPPEQWGGQWPGLDDRVARRKPLFRKRGPPPPELLGTRLSIFKRISGDQPSCCPQDGTFQILPTVVGGQAGAARHRPRTIVIYITESIRTGRLLRAEGKDSSHWSNIIIQFSIQKPVINEASVRTS